MNNKPCISWLELLKTNLSGRKCWYEGHSYNIVIKVLMGVLFITFKFLSLQLLEVFFLDGNTVK